MLGDEALEFLAHPLFVRRHPVDGKGCLIPCFGEVAGGVAGELEDSGATHAPMGDKQGTTGTETGAGKEGGGIGNDGAHEFTECGIGYGEGEEGRYGWQDGVACSSEGVGEGCVGTQSARGDDDIVVGVESGEVVDTLRGTDVHLQASCCGEETVDDGL